MGEFKKFIQTNGRSFDEIKRTINDLVNRAVDNVVDTVINDVTEFAPKEVRKELKQKAAAARQSSAKSAYKSERIPPKRFENNDDRGLNEYVQKRGHNADFPEQNRIHYPHESHAENISPQEEFMLSKIGEMRELEICVRGHGAVKRAVELTMLEQGEFMADIEDDFSRRAFCALPQPVYAAMSNSQLRTFFTWRTDVRRGKYSETDKPYVLLYCCELLNKIGVNGSVEAFDKLLETWECCKDFAPYLNSLMPRWLKDFYAFNEVSEKYPDINAVLKNGSSNEYEREFFDIESGNYSGKLRFLAENSAYDLKKSIFFTEETIPLLDAACEEALHALEEYFSARGIELSELICGKLKKDYSWTPFKDAIVNLDTADGFKPVKISASERYCVKRGEPALEMFDFAPSRGFIGFLLKSVEAELRLKTGFSRKIVPKLSMLQNDFTNRTKITEAISAPEFLKIIPKAVDEYCRKAGIASPKKSAKRKDTDEYVDYTVPKVEIDVSKLSEIRDKSDELAKKLIIEEPSDELNAAEEIAAQIGDDEFSAQIEDFKQELSPVEAEELPLSSGDPAFEDLDADWRTFANNLTPMQIKTLNALLNGNARTFCKENGLLPETVFEEINTEALSAFGDVVIECGELVSDYVDEITKIVKAALG